MPERRSPDQCSRPPPPHRTPFQLRATLYAPTDDGAGWKRVSSKLSFQLSAVLKDKEEPNEDTYYQLQLDSVRVLEHEQVSDARAVPTVTSILTAYRTQYYLYYVHHATACRPTRSARRPTRQQRRGHGSTALAAVRLLMSMIGFPPSKMSVRSTQSESWYK